MIFVRDIMAATASHYEIKVSDLAGPSRQRVFCHPRQIAMYISRRHTGKSVSDIGRAFGGRDHTTVLHAERVVTERMDAEIREDINRIMEAISVLRERNLGGIFRSVRAPKSEFKSRRVNIT